VYSFAVLTKTAFRDAIHRYVYICYGYALPIFRSLALDPGRGPRLASA
jgi:hypothetical protein